MNKSEIIEIIKEKCPIAHQGWMDKRGWILLGPNDCNKYPLQVWIYDNQINVSPHGWGASQALIAKTPNQLRECIEMWWRNREDE